MRESLLIVCLCLAWHFIRNKINNLIRVMNLFSWRSDAAWNVSKSVNNNPNACDWSWGKWRLGGCEWNHSGVFFFFLRHLPIWVVSSNATPALSEFCNIHPDWLCAFLKPWQLFSHDFLSSSKDVWQLFHFWKHKSGSLVTNTATTVLGFETLSEVSGVLSKRLSHSECLELEDTQLDCWNT